MTPLALISPLAIITVFSVMMTVTWQDEEEGPPPIRDEANKKSEFATLLDLARDIDRAALEESRERQRFEAEIEDLDQRIASIREQLVDVDEQLVEQRAAIDEVRAEKEQRASLAEESKQRARLIAKSLSEFAIWLDGWARPRLDREAEAALFSKIVDGKTSVDGDKSDLGAAWRSLHTAASEALAIGSRCEQGILSLGETPEEGTVLGDAMIVGSVYSLIVTPDRTRGVLRDFLGKDIVLNLEGLEATDLSLDVLSRVRSAVRSNVPFPMSVFRRPQDPVTFTEGPR